MSKAVSHVTTWLPAACRAARAWLDWRASDLADRLGITLRQMQRIEAGARTTEARLATIVAVFAVEGLRIGPEGVLVDPEKRRRRHRAPALRTRTR